MPDDPKPADPIIPKPDEIVTPPKPAVEPGDTPDPAAEAEKWKTLARKHEERAKANASAADELAALKVSQMTDQEKAVTEARDAGKAEATSVYAQRLAAAEIKAALTGIVADPASIVDDINLAKYVTDKGDVDAEAIVQLAERFAALAPTPGKPNIDLRQGNRGKNDSPTLDEQIAEAMKTGDTKAVMALNARKLAVVTAASH